MIKKAVKIISILCLALGTFCTVNLTSVSAKSENVTPYALVTVRNVDKTITVNNTGIDPGNTVTFTYKLEGSYLLSNNGGFYSVSDVDLAFSSVSVKINGSSTSVIYGRIINVNRTIGSKNVTITYTLQYRFSGSSTWRTVEDKSITV
ncbi:hypothetical protein [Traorella massiliensis]|uniref:hypothetical protein n=1 Tax=Traorella massiliensis TaxID=1903263 RepID=UPI0008F81ADC|nr:hypothetical protein [Traorella massiliensis]